MEFNDIYINSSKPIFKSVKPTSNLVKPNKDSFLLGVKESYDCKVYAGSGKAKLLEKKLAVVHGTEHCISFCNGFWGLVLTVKALCLPGKHEVVMPTMTYRRLADITAWLNLTPHFCDISPEVLGPSVETVEPCINSNTGLLLIAQPIVNVCDMSGFERLGNKYGIPVLFDSVEAAIGTLNSRKIGSFGAAECFSMHASKLINAFEAGYVTTNDQLLADRLRLLRCNGIDSRGDIVELGLHAQLNEIHASMALTGLSELKVQIKRNIARYNLYKQLLVDVPGIKLVEYDGSELRGYKNILIELRKAWPLSRQNTIELMHQDNMLVRPYYWPPLHEKKTSYTTVCGTIQHARKLSAKYLLLPSGAFVTNDDIYKIVEYLYLLQKNAKIIMEKLNYIDNAS